MVTKTAVLRDGYAQTKYRKNSYSRNKEKQHVAHKFSLELGKQVQKGIPGPMAAKNLKKVFNNEKNFRMVSAKTNLGEHRAIDKKIVEKSKNKEALTQKEEKRARQQVKFLQSKKNELPKRYYEQARGLYKPLKTKSGKTMWDSRKDRVTI